MSEPFTLTWRERLIRRALADPKNYPANNYHLPTGVAGKLWQRGFTLLCQSLSPAAARWPAIYGMPRPALAILDSPKTGGSHFVLHHLQRHPELLCLHEQIMFGEVRRYFMPQGYPLYKLIANQLVPYKSDLGRVKHIVINKPAMETVFSQFYSRRAEITFLPLLRNPVGFCLSGAQRRLAKAREMGQATPEAMTHMEDYLLAVMKQFIRKGVDFFDPVYDLGLNLEHFALHPQQAMAALEARLGLAHAPAERSLRLDRCARCGGELRSEQRPVKSRPAEAVLVCGRCRAVYIGPGGFNLLREMGRAEFGRWAQDPRAPRLFELCEAFFGRALMDYFRGERYLEPEGHLEFSSLFNETVARLEAGAGAAD